MKSNHDKYDQGISSLLLKMIYSLVLLCIGYGMGYTHRENDARSEMDEQIQVDLESWKRGEYGPKD